jgi:hypothetical protein
MDEIRAQILSPSALDFSQNTNAKNCKCLVMVFIRTQCSMLMPLSLESIIFLAGAGTASKYLNVEFCTILAMRKGSDCRSHSREPHLFPIPEPEPHQHDAVAKHWLVYMLE